MISEREIWACAHQLMKMHGIDVGFVAAQRADELLQFGAIDGHRVFMRIVKRIEELAALTPSGRVQ